MIEMDFLREIITMDKAAGERVEKAVAKQKQRTDEFGESSAREREQKLADERDQNAAFKDEQEKLLAKYSNNANIEGLENVLYACPNCGRDKRFAENGERWRAEILKRITEE